MIVVQRQRILQRAHGGLHDAHLAGARTEGKSCVFRIRVPKARVRQRLPACEQREREASALRQWGRGRQPLVIDLAATTDPELRGLETTKAAEPASARTQGLEKAFLAYPGRRYDT